MRAMLCDDMRDGREEDEARGDDLQTCGMWMISVWMCTAVRCGATVAVLWVGWHVCAATQTGVAVAKIDRTCC